MLFREFIPTSHKRTFFFKKKGGGIIVSYCEAATYKCGDNFPVDRLVKREVHYAVPIVRVVRSKLHWIRFIYKSDLKFTVDSHHITQEILL